MVEQKRNIQSGLHTRKPRRVQVATIRCSVGVKVGGSLELRFAAHSGTERGNPAPRYRSNVVEAWSLAVWEGFPKPNVLHYSAHVGASVPILGSTFSLS